MLRADARGGRTAMTQSMPVSPAIGAISPHIGPSDKSSLKMEALKKAAIHLLAVRPVSERYITSTLRCTSGELAPLLQKYGRPSRLDPAKLDLSDRGYKELDVWLFKYGAEDDRQSAIAHAIKAFDRMRISREERIWQMLLPKSKRGKGIILSKLQLHGGPIERVKTPRIHVQPTDESNNGGYSTGNESDRMRGRLAPSDAENMARSRSQDSIKKSKVSQKEAQSKRLLSKKPAKATPAAKPKVERPVAKPTPKAAAKKDAGAFGRKVKSAEFVENSGEDVEMVDAPPVGASSQKARPAVRAVKAAAKDLKIAKAVKAATRPIRATTQLFKPLPMPAKDPIDAKSTSKDPKAFETDAKLPPKESKSTAADPVKKSLPSQSSKEGKGKDAKHLASSNPLHVETRTRNVSKMSPLSSSSSGTNSRPSDGSQASVPMGRTVSHKRTTSSPVKPSPLGSSPPTNASDLEKEQDASKHSCSASPAKTGQKDQGASARKSIPRPTNAFDGDSDTSLKRKANDVDSDIHRHETSVPPDHGRKFKRQQTTSPSESDLSMTVPELTELDLLSRAFYDETLLYHKAHKRLSKKEATLGHEDVDEIKGLQASAQRLRNMQLKIYELAQQQQPGNGWTPPPLESEEIVDMDVSGMSVDALMEGVDMNRTLGEGHA
jgi:RNA polymerase II elongation factor ELL